MFFARGCVESAERKWISGESTNERRQESANDEREKKNASTVYHYGKQKIWRSRQCDIKD